MLSLNNPSYEVHQRRFSDRRIPGSWNQHITRAGLLHVAMAGEGEMESLDQQLVGDRHIVNLVAGLLCERPVGVEYQLPFRMIEEQVDGGGGDVDLHEDLL